jgi:hypothetical protein
MSFGLLPMGLTQLLVSQHFRVQDPRFLVQISLFRLNLSPETGDLSVTAIVKSEISNGFYSQFS